ncbi:MAG: response regulator transcription factor [Cryomorphaceae bacterium]|nr:response regulator transcription factor [Cryomorphaceae bacterium]
MEETKVLIIDDERELADSIAEFLELKGYKTAVCHNGQEAISTLKSFKTDVIICDIAMPVMDGLELLNTIRSEDQWNHIPFIFLTAKTTKDDMRLGMISGADDYILKPFKLTEVDEAIKTRINRSKQLLEQNKIDKHQREQINQLTKKEKQVFKLISEGLSSKQIAEKLFVSIKTIENHRYNITQKLNLEGQGSLLKFAMAHKNALD